jgi:hypothetical protein
MTSIFSEEEGLVDISLVIVVVNVAQFAFHWVQYDCVEVENFINFVNPHRDLYWERDVEGYLQLFMIRLNKIERMRQR